RLIDTSRLSGWPFSLVIGDIYHFMSVNDRYGHPAGDSVLTSVAAILKQRIRQPDVAARTAGEQFMILVTDSSLKQSTE
ncbi:GGDEF domain-containing protein, partial [Pseudomonas syringae group genomosp. 7]|uniref:GGDEF domain-containing protein n=1 Tax=Pseudomonas syringae group genomosp. 7 TaxID=251699 RepID=UPI0037701C66